MKILHSSLLVLWLALLSGCNANTTVTTEKGKITSASNKPVKLSADGQPHAEITAAGDFAIDGKPVQVTAEQRALLQTYHREMMSMTNDGIAIGKQGAALAGKAVSEAIKGAVSGSGSDVQSKVEAEAKEIEHSAMQLCKRLVTIKAAQDELAAQLPVFKPYSSIEVSDIEDCNSSQ